MAKRKGHGGVRRGAGRPPTIEDAQKLTLALGRPTLAKLRALALREGVPVAVYVRQVLERHVKRAR